MVRIFVLGALFVASLGFGEDLHQRRTAEREVLNLLRDRVTGPALQEKVIPLVAAIQSTPLPGDPSRADLGELLQMSKGAGKAETIHPRYRPLVITTEQSAELNQLLKQGTPKGGVRSWITPGTLAQLKASLSHKAIGQVILASTAPKREIAQNSSKVYRSLPPVHPAVRWLLATLGMLVFAKMVFGRYISHE